MFYLSFLIRDGKCALEIENGEPTICKLVNKSYFKASDRSFISQSYVIRLHQMIMKRAWVSSRWSWSSTWTHGRYVLHLTFAVRESDVCNSGPSRSSTYRSRRYHSATKMWPALPANGLDNVVASMAGVLYNIILALVSSSVSSVSIAHHISHLLSGIVLR